MSMVMSLVGRRNCIITRPSVIVPGTGNDGHEACGIQSLQCNHRLFAWKSQKPSALARLNELICVPSECREGPPLV